jgi:hypothetical protein
VFSFTPTQLPLVLRSPRVLVTAGVGIAAVVGITGYMITRRKPSAEEVERERRDLLARIGRITDGTILDTFTDPLTTTLAPGAEEFGSNADSLDSVSSVDLGEDAIPAPHIIVYNYRIAGVSYECAQDVTSLADHVLGVRTDLPIQVRYEPHNPGNSIVVAESWSGLRLLSTHPLHHEPKK